MNVVVGGQKRLGGVPYGPDFVEHRSLHDLINRNSSVSTTSAGSASDSAFDPRPTIDQIYEDVKNRIPGVSRTTVYRTLETLAELGVAKKTSHVDAVARFDGNVDHHHHLVCVRCDKVVDFADPALSKLPLPDARRTGFEIVDFSVYLEGICRECKDKRTSSRGRNGARKSNR